MITARDAKDISDTTWWERQIRNSAWMGNTTTWLNFTTSEEADEVRGVLIDRQFVVSNVTTKSTRRREPDDFSFTVSWSHL